MRHSTLLAGLLLLAAPIFAQEAGKASTAEITRLERVEELSEDLANDLLELSVAVRDKDSKAIRTFFADSLLASPFACLPQALKTRVKWICDRAWLPVDTDGPVAEQRPTDGARFHERWMQMLGQFPSIEDVRFKMKEGDFDDKDNARVRVAFYVIGRNLKQQREWLRGNVWITAAKSDGHWRWSSYKPLSIDSLVATEDLFTDVAAGIGLAVELPAYTGGYAWNGAATADLNGDGFLDLFTTTGGRNRIYLSEAGVRFKDASEATGVAGLASGLAPLLLDVDHDGDLDVFLSGIGPQVLLQNRFVPDGVLAFDDVSAVAGVQRDAVGFSAVAGDVNNDGFEDIYVCSYNHYGRVTPDSWFKATNGTPNLLFINKGDGTFKEAAHAWGVDDKRWSYAAQFVDLDRDGRMDLYVANDFGEKALFMNKGDHFVDEAAQRGAMDAGNGMGVSFGDFDNDGHLDIHASNMSSTAGNRIIGRIFAGATASNNVLKKLAAGNNLLRNKGDGTFEDVTAAIGGFSGGWAWGGGFIDFDNDGWSDFFCPNGFVSGPSMKDT
ncbi:MAG: VCBS repeat-containing protein [Planctomycetes bacterium]|nr:VCBS repeat-containing protein [Planctomycetota bacterium]